MRLVSSFLLLLFSICANAGIITARSYLVTDDHGLVITGKNADHVQPIASITKLMTVMVVLDAEQPKDELIKLDWSKATKYHTRLPRTIKKLTRDDLIDLAIVKSDNFAAWTLCASYSGGVDSCVAAMNQKAQQLNMANTQFVDPTGLEKGNVSNAYDLVRMVMIASTYLDITDASNKPKVSIEVKKHWWEFKNTNPLVKADGEIHVSKTGYIGVASGGCIVMYLETNLGPRIVVLLGSHNTHTRIPEAEEIILTVTSNDIRVK